MSRTPATGSPPSSPLAAQFAVSRNTVRDALRMLEISGLITLRKGTCGGARLWIESVVVRVACERMTDEQLAALAANVKEAAGPTQADKPAVKVGVRNGLGAGALL